MENDPSSQENSDQATDDQQGDHQNIQQEAVRSYECTFCKRGFSNAQALGGHMNIHRKDKAKLKKSSTSASSNDQSSTHRRQQPIEIPKSNIPPLYPPFIPSTNKIFSDIHEDQKVANKKWSWNFPPEKDDIATSTRRDQLQQLPLFVETTSSRRKNDEESGGKGSSSISSHEELDLELRLGHDPQDQSSAATGMKKFL